MRARPARAARDPDSRRRRLSPAPSPRLRFGRETPVPLRLGRPGPRLVVGRRSARPALTDRPGRP
ncbi:hypothetical protein ACFPM0_21580 [Pseudonocardia sulfidoxydans]|uniref:hypothetical protein n=1 Tax=Pseudonocardia sulfidoxydans TaxID=54011 RepID=UPI00361C8522